MNELRKIFVFGSNREARHGAGAALVAHRDYGALYGIPEGLQGNAYGIITKELRPDHPPVTLEEVAAGVKRFTHYAWMHPGWLFIVTPIGTGLAGFTIAQIAPLFKDACALPNVEMNPVFEEFNL